MLYLILNDFLFGKYILCLASSQYTDFFYSYYLFYNLSIFKQNYIQYIFKIYKKIIKNCNFKVEK